MLIFDPLTFLFKPIGDLPKNLRALQISPTKKLSRIKTSKRMFQTVWKILIKRDYMRRKLPLKRLWTRCKWKISNWGLSFKINKDKSAKRMKWCNRSWKTYSIHLVLKIQRKISCRSFRDAKSTTTHKACLRTSKNRRWRLHQLVPCRKLLKVRVLWPTRMVSWLHLKWRWRSWMINCF